MVPTAEIKVSTVIFFLILSSICVSQGRILSSGASNSLKNEGNPVFLKQHRPDVFKIS